MRNERLRALLLERGKTSDQLAEHVQVDAKTVERWITKGRLPHRRHRFEVASFLGVDESYIWPDALGRDEVAIVSESEVAAVAAPLRGPRGSWGHLFSGAEREIGVLVYAGLLLSRTPACGRSLRTRPVRACGVRVLLGSSLLLTVAR
jgi:transcriptional regulator with XRE-family HTH domain